MKPESPAISSDKELERPKSGMAPPALSEIPKSSPPESQDGRSSPTADEAGKYEGDDQGEKGESGEPTELKQTTTQNSHAPGGVLHPDSFPDGGWAAWSTVIGGFCCLFVSFGWINTIGVFQTVYQESILKEYSPSTIAWIVSCESFLMFLGGPFMGVLFDNYGPRPLLIAGTFFHVFGLMMASISTQYWQFLLAQGFCSPIGASAVFYAAMSSVVTWFHKRRGLALGLMASGSSLGGVIFPIMTQNLIPKVGFPWAMRTAAFTVLALLAIANLTVRPRIKPKPRRFEILGLVKPLGQPTFALLALGSFCVFFGLFIPFTFLPLQGLSVGMDPTLDSYIIPILNAVSIFGRITPGYLSDHVGRFNVTIAMCALCGILVLALWLPSRGPAPVVVFAALYGFGSGAFVSIVPALVATVTPDMRTIGARNGTLFAFISVGALCGAPIAGALLSRDNGNWAGLQIYSGCFLLAGTVIITGVRLMLSEGKLYAKI